MPSSKLDEALKSAEEALALAWSNPNSSNIPCREKEIEHIVSVCKSRFETKTPGSLYICGCPGTGKTMAVKKATQLLSSDWKNAEKGGSIETMHINCMSLSDPRQLLEMVTERASAPTQNAGCRPQKRRKRCTTAEERPLLLVADEVDVLSKSGRDQKLLEQLFQLPQQLTRLCVLIGISNTLHLVDRFLPTLKALQCAPETLTFSAYTQPQVLSILKHRLEGDSTEPLTRFFHPKALELCSKKVAATSGDVRRALDACRQSLNLAQAEASSQTESEGANSEPNTEQARAGAPQVFVDIHHMANALACTLKTPAFELIKSLPLHQQMVLCALVMDARSKRNDPTIQEVYSSYCYLHKKQALVPLSFGEFSMLCKTLSDQGLTKMMTRLKKRRIALETRLEDVTIALQGVRLFRSILEC